LEFEKKNRAETTFEVIRVENFPEVVTDTKAQLKETQQIPSKTKRNLQLRTSK
jgi:hypothetical protein